jgi:hypothetical protein
VTSWRRLKEIAQKVMKEGGFTTEDVMNDLKDYRAKQNLIESLKQVKEIREGRLPKKTWQEYIDENEKIFRTDESS